MRPMRRRVRTDQQPWWEKTLTIAVLTGILGAMAPLSAAILGHYQKEAQTELKQGELELARERQAHEVRSHYLNLVLDPKSDLKTQIALLDYVIKSLPEDVALREWSIDQRDRLLEVSASDKNVRIAAEEMRAEQDRLWAQAQRQARRIEELERRSVLDANARKERDDLKMEVEQLKAAIRQQAEPVDALVDQNLTQRESSLAGPAVETQKMPVGMGGGGNNFCCIECGGAMVCGVVVMTACGSCSVEGF